MAGERKGITYEAIVKIALDELVRKGKLCGNVFWNVKPDALTIEPDFTVGSDRNNPTHVFLVTHSASTSNSHMKFWRNIGELAEAKSELPFVPSVFSVVFDSEVKLDLIAVQAAAFDGQLIAGYQPYGPMLRNWIDEHSMILPSQKHQKLEVLQSLLKTDSQLLDMVKLLTIDLEATLSESTDALSALWGLHRHRSTTMAPIARDTFYRRAFAKAMVLGIKPQSMTKNLPGDWGWALPLGLVTRTITGYRVVDQDLIWLSKSSLASEDTTLWPTSMATKGFRNQLQKVRSIALLVCFRHYITTHLETLKTQRGMKQHLERLHADPQSGIELPVGVLPPTGLWLFDFIGALVKARASRAQAFGYSSFSSHPNSNAFKVGNMNVGTWCACFVNQFFSRTPGFTLTPEVLDFVATVLSDILEPFSVQSIESLASEIEARYVAKELDAVLLAHRGFDPIGALLLSRSGVLSAKGVRIRASFAEQCGARGGAASTGVLQISRTVIYWQSAHGSHTNDKRKELCGRAVAIRYCWDGRVNRFTAREGIDRLFLIVDGTWTQSDLVALQRAGWDEIFYPDEMNKLVEAIV